MSDLLSMLWVEKYRPKTLDEVSLAQGYKEKFSEFISNREIPHLLLYGPQGSGKTTVARILCGSICSDKRNVMVLNGSSKEHRSLSNVASIESFCQSPPWGNDKIKIVFIDEADNLTADAFLSLRVVFEKYAENARFLWTCNYRHKMPAPILSRLVQFEFSQFDKDYVIVICEDILNNEGVEYDPKALAQIVDMLFPDVRGIINTLQKLTVNGKLDASNLEELKSIEKKIIDELRKIIAGIRQDTVDKEALATVQNYVANTPNINYLSLYEAIFKDPSISWPVKMICNKYSLQHNQALSPEMHFMSFIYETIMFGKELKRLLS